MSAEFNWWLLIVGLVAGGALTWLVLADSSRRERELSEEEVAAEAGWLARSLDVPGLDADLAERVLRAHRRYLGFPPPDVLVAPEELPSLEAMGVAEAPPLDLAGETPGPMPDLADFTPAGAPGDREPAEPPGPGRP